MDWQTLWTYVGPPLAGAASWLAASRYLGDWWLEGVRTRHSAKLTEAQNTFAMGATSHMATIAFDKHIAFCEEYVGETSRALYARVREGLAYEPPDAGRFLTIRQRWVVWLTRDIEARLDRFEADLRRFDAGAAFYRPDGMPESNKQIIEVRVKEIVADLREILGIEQLTAIRKNLILRSSKDAS
jgi:hypothetical protein